MPMNIDKTTVYTGSTCDLDLVFVGHWSGCSSNRHSLDSDHVVKAETNPASTSQCSLGNDSGRDSPIPPESRYSYYINRHRDETHPKQASAKLNINLQIQNVHQKLHKIRT